MMYFAIKNFKHSGKFCKVGEEYIGEDIELLLRERLIEKKEVVKNPIKEVEKIEVPKKKKKVK